VVLIEETIGTSETPTRAPERLQTPTIGDEGDTGDLTNSSHGGSSDNYLDLSPGRIEGFSIELEGERTKGSCIELEGGRNDGFSTELRGVGTESSCTELRIGRTKGSFIEPGCGGTKRIYSEDKGRSFAYTVPPFFPLESWALGFCKLFQDKRFRKEVTDQVHWLTACGATQWRLLRV
jgi:hypothetical protein